MLFLRKEWFPRHIWQTTLLSTEGRTYNCSTSNYHNFICLKDSVRKRGCRYYCDFESGYPLSCSRRHGCRVCRRIVDLSCSYDGRIGKIRDGDSDLGRHSVTENLGAPFSESVLLNKRTGLQNWVRECRCRCRCGIEPREQRSTGAGH